MMNLVMQLMNIFTRRILTSNLEIILRKMQLMNLMVKSSTNCETRKNPPRQNIHLDYDAKHNKQSFCS
ncbi:hypothetical protein Hanom_Chr02g00122031 [Helianthus anomalus]